MLSVLAAHVHSWPTPPRSGFLLFWPWREAKVERTLTHSESIPVQRSPAVSQISQQQLIFKPLIVNGSAGYWLSVASLSLINLFLVYNLFQSEVFNLLTRFHKITLLSGQNCILHISKQTGPSNLKIFRSPEIWQRFKWYKCTSKPFKTWYFICLVILNIKRYEIYEMVTTNDTHNLLVGWQNRGSKLYFNVFLAADIIIDLTLHTTQGGRNIFILVKCDKLLSTVCSL